MSGRDPQHQSHRRVSECKTTMNKVDPAQLYTEYSCRVISFLVADGLSYPEAWQLTLDSFAGMIEKWHEFPVTPGKEELEIFAFVLNELENFRWGKQHGLPRKLPAVVLPEDEFSQKRNAMLEAMAELPGTMRTVYALSRCGRLNIRSIAALTGGESGQIMQRISRAKEKLARKMKDFKYV